MFLKSRIFVSRTCINITKRHLSNEIREVFNMRLSPPNNNGTQLHLAVVSKNLNAVNLDLYVNNLGNDEDRCSAILDLVANLRAQKLANTCLESTQFAVVRHLLKNLTIQEVAPVLLDRLRYGIFLNNFTGFVATEILHEENEYILGLPLALKLILSEEVDSEFIQFFCLKASLETLKKEDFAKPTCDDKSVSPPKKKKIEEKKVRVNFIRNVYVTDINTDIGKATLKIAAKLLEGNTRANANILGFVLTKNYSELEKVLTNLKEINEDIANICKNVLSRENQKDFIDKINKCKISTASFGNIIDVLFKEVHLREPAVLAENQKLLFPIWEQLRTKKQIEIEKETAEKERKDNIDVIRNEIANKKELLWFFENEEKIDLEIYNKEAMKPKKSLGKKGAAGDVDEEYIPPEIRKRD